MSRCPAADRCRYVLADDDILTLARWACLIEEHYSTKHGCPTPMDMEWAKDGLSGELFIVQARPETVQARKAQDVLERYHLAATRAGLGPRAERGGENQSWPGAHDQGCAPSADASRRGRCWSRIRPILTGSRS